MSVCNVVLRLTAHADRAGLSMTVTTEGVYFVLSGVFLFLVFSHYLLVTYGMLNWVKLSK